MAAERFVGQIERISGISQTELAEIGVSPAAQMDGCRMSSFRLQPRRAQDVCLVVLKMIPKNAT